MKMMITGINIYIMISIDSQGRLDLKQLHPNQKRFIASNYLHTAIVGGYQSGKSTAGVVKVLTKLLINPQVPCAYYLPTYGLIEDMLVPKFKDLFETLGIAYVHNQKHSRFTTQYGQIWMRSMDNPDRIISYSVGYSIVDEADVVAPNKMQLTYGRIVSRNSFKTKGRNSIDFVSTPEGFGFMHKLFVKNKNANKLHLKLSTLDNISNLGDGYIDGLREAYTPEQLKAYLKGEFVNLTSGTVYHHFDRNDSDSDRKIGVGEVLHIGMDFNITNMNAVIHVIDRCPIAVAELTGVYDTASMIQRIKERFRGHSIVVYPDASGKNRSTSGKSDVRLLREARFIIKSPSKNPFVRDRVNAMNNAFRNNKGIHNYLVNTNNCPVYTEALEQQSYKKGVPDKDSGFDHVCEAGGYFIHQQTKPRFIKATAH